MEEDSPIFFRIRILHKNHFLPLQTPKSVIPFPRRSFQTYPPSHVQNPPRHFSHGCIPIPSESPSPIPLSVLKIPKIMLFKIFLKIFKKLLTFYSGWSRITHVLRMRHPQENKISAFSSVGRAVDS